MEITVTPTAAESFDLSLQNAFYDITFTNSNIINYAANSKVYFYALLTDSTPVTPLTREVTFALNETTQGSIAADTPQTFTFENTTSLVAPVTASAGRICYVAQ
jgi:hypothetical protein